jgi:small-conductance mechanosensitive channel
MPPGLSTSERVAMAILVAPFLYLAGVLIGRVLKRRAGVQLGMLYQVFCIVLSVSVALRLFSLDYPLARPANAEFDLQREAGSLATLLGAFFLIALMRRFLWEIYFEEKKKREIPKFLREVAAIVVFLIVVLWVMGFSYHETIPGLLAGSGIAAVILGIAMQDMLGNIIAGLAVEFGKPFKAGDWLTVDKYTAEVMEVNWRSTRLRTNDHISLEIPNSQMVKQPIINLTFPTRMHAMRVRVGVEYSSPPNLVKEVLMDAALGAKSVLKNPHPKIFLVEFGDSAVIYEIKFYFEDHMLYNEIVDNIQTNVWYGLDRHKIKIPIRTVKIERKGQEPYGVTPGMRAALRQRPFFLCMDEVQIDRLIETANLCRFGRGEMVIEQGAEGNSMFILVRGEADVYVNRDGERAPVATLAAGDYFGEMSLLTGEKRSATVIAKVDCDVLEVDKAQFSKIVQDNPSLLERLSDLLTQRRLEVEGVLASAPGEKALSSMKLEYKAGFLKKLSSIFAL